MFNKLLRFSQIILLCTYPLADVFVILRGKIERHRSSLLCGRQGSHAGVLAQLPRFFPCTHRPLKDVWYILVTLLTGLILWALTSTWGTSSAAFTYCTLWPQWSDGAALGKVALPPACRDNAGILQSTVAAITVADVVADCLLLLLRLLWWRLCCVRATHQEAGSMTVES